MIFTDGGDEGGRTPVRQYSTRNIYRLMLNLVLAFSVASSQARISQQHQYSSHSVSWYASSHCQSDVCRNHELSDILHDHVAIYWPICLRSVSVFVIVVGNYIFAAFNEASGASACRSGFYINVEANASP